MYKALQAATGWAATVGAASYTMAAVIALSDGHDRGFEIPDQIATIAVPAIVVLGVVSMAMRIAEHTNRASVETVCCVVATEMEKQLSRLVDEQLQDMVAGALEEATTRAYRAGVVGAATQAASGVNGATVHRIPGSREVY